MDKSAAWTRGPKAGSGCPGLYHVAALLSERLCRNGASRVSRSERDNVARVRVLDSVNSPLRGQVLSVVDVKVKARLGATKVSYLCEMPGHEHPGWFRESEVEVVA